MSINKLAQHFEVQFWDIIILIAQEEGLLMKTIKKANSIGRSRIKTFLLLILVWSAVGFTVGLIFGKVISILQYF
jgi:hypothetical protein